ncbi:MULTISPECIES: precorrin-3B synthase [Mesorhizobium]|uniref:Precorrin-3B synthase n=1 Tax=Mesorhizobium denitrificans TaxID=2294114 RepID=A0A371XFY7_9HYPH|nr:MULTISPECIES: precorrin-3B synthase [Mesorhizobium]RFC68131.1 precorrin-3B synthase [Mesorhizobium denitrificans]
MMAAARDINVRGACPALAAPMQTGDGLLARLNPVREGLSAKQLIGLCECALRHGNGIVEITSRGSLQIRGLTEPSALALADDINRLDIDVRTGTTVATGPLAGMDPDEVADPRPLAQSIRDGITRLGLNGRLAPKVSVVVDGGGAWSLDDLQADIRCRADGALWHVAIGDEPRTLGRFAEAHAAAVVLEALEAVAARGPMARARDLNIGATDVAERAPRAIPLGNLALKDRNAMAVVLPFGSVEAGVLAEFAKQAQALGATEFRAVPPRALIMLLDAPNVEGILKIAQELGFVVDARDPAMRIFACPGKPACTSGTFKTRETARNIVREVPELFTDNAFSLHVSGCAKGCAHPSQAALTLVGEAETVGIVVGGTARSLPLAYAQPNALVDALKEME